MIKNFLFILFVFTSVLSFSQETEKISPRLDFTYLKKTDGSRLLSANLYIVLNRISYPVTSANIVFEVGTMKAEVLTNMEGVANLIVDKNVVIETVADRFAKYKADFSGNDTLELVTAELLVKDVFLNLILDEIDSVRTIKVQLKVLSENGDSIPVSGEIINLYVPRMFNRLKIGEETTDDEGMITLEFPNDLPGSPDSTIKVIARLDEHEQFANVEVEKTVRWGVPIIHRIPESHRALWTEIAPVWMIITLTVMLLGVWGHYIFVIVQLILIKKDSKKQND